MPFKKIDVSKEIEKQCDNDKEFAGLYDSQKKSDDQKLERAKEMAIDFLRLPLGETQYSPFIVQHPFFDSAIMFDNGNTFDAFQDKEKYEKCVQKMLSLIADCKRIKDILWLVKKPYKLTYLKFLTDRDIISTKECGNLLAGAWSLIEIINDDVNVSKSQVLRWISKADKRALMNDEEYSVYENLPETVTVYRGCADLREAKGISWTLSPKVASFFADRYGKGKVFQAQIAKSDVIGYLDDRDEQEVILNYNRLQDIKEIRKKKL